MVSGKVILEDLESKNGTFVNGMRIRKKELRPGDRISFQDVVLELSIAKEKRIAPSVPLQPWVRDPSGSERSQSFLGEKVQSLRTAFEPTIQMIMQHLEWKYVTLILFSAFVLTNFLITIPSLLDHAQVKLQTEAIKRGEFITKRIGAENQKHLSLKEGLLIADHFHLTTALAQQEERILSVNIIDPKTKRILAPAERLDLPIDNREVFLRGSDVKKLSFEKINDREVLISYPVTLYSSAEDRDVVGAVVQATFNIEGIGISSQEYSQLLLKFLLLSLFGGVVFYFLFHTITSMAFKKIYTEIDTASQKGFRHLDLKTKFEEMNAIVHTINKVFKKTRDLVSKLPEEGKTSDERLAENTDEILKNLLQVLPDGVVVLNTSYQIIHMNSSFEKISELKTQEALNRNILEILKNEELAKNISHGLNQAAFGIEIQENLDVHNHRYQLAVSAAKSPTNQVDFYILNLKRMD
ncbi:MAG: FHA domain-containing protein [Deltaproteobacteria bacterium]|nr:FHA domain-containing protein [Deltaproteobacteria bacterium]